MRVHFICRGNAYRSRLAEAYLKSLDTVIEVISSGTVANDHRKQNIPVIRLVRQFLDQKGLGTGMDYEPIQLTQQRLAPDDTVVFINQKVYRDFINNFSAPEHMSIWDVKDFDEMHPNPDITDPEFPAQFLSYTEEIFKQIQSNTDKLVSKLSVK